MHAFSKPELLAILAAARARRESDWLAILVAYHHGLRASEVVAIKRDDIRDGYLTVKRLKGSDPTTQELVKHENPLLDERFALQQFAGKSNPNLPLFKMRRETFTRIVKRHCRTAGVPDHKAHAHALKHSTAMHMIDKAGIHRTQQYLGHKSARSTQEYLKVSDQEAGDVAGGVLGRSDV